MSCCPVPRVVRIIERVRTDLERHSRDCGDRVVALALNPQDHAELSVVELWGMPVLAWTKVDRGRYRLLCEANGVLIPRMETVDELLEHWAYHLQPATAPPGRVAT